MKPYLLDHESAKPRKHLLSPEVSAALIVGGAILGFVLILWLLIRIVGSIGVGAMAG